MSNKLEIYKTLVASTAHIDSDDIEAIHSFPEIFSCYTHDYGVRIHMSEGIIESAGQLLISEGLKLLILFAVSNDCAYLDLDSDGPEYDDFPQYDW